ncbi:MAG: hypothetical protein JSV21_02585 [Nitrospirota bacterium]|nr:MAG: hypothetical protein JSV21_02585 [Nitrospirota bacterium]
MIARMNGGVIRSEYDRYAELVMQGIAGFIVFGGELDEVREHIARLQNIADVPLLIASDMEQGAGQQLVGATMFPPAMAISRLDKDEAEAVFRVYAEEALYAGINMILAPVVDINTDPDNPIISVRSYGHDKGKVSEMSGSMIDTLRSNGIRTCAKHFPGHGDTSIDSHISLPLIDKDIDKLEQEEICPFRDAVGKDVSSIMLGHIAVPAIDPENVPMSISGKAVRYINERLDFEGLLMTDALNMGGLSAYGQNKAAEMALNAGVDILLHPDAPAAMNEYLNSVNARSEHAKLESFRKGLSMMSDDLPGFERNMRLAQRVTERSIDIGFDIGRVRPSSVLVLKEEGDLSSGILEAYLREQFNDVPYVELNGEASSDVGVKGDRVMTVIYSATGAWKGKASGWFNSAVQRAKLVSSHFIVLGNPYVIHDAGCRCIYTYWCSELSEAALVNIFKQG